MEKRRRVCGDKGERAGSFGMERRKLPQTIVEVSVLKELQKERLSRELWLGYFNQVLRQEGIITERDFLNMARKIRANRKVD